MRPKVSGRRVTCNQMLDKERFYSSIRELHGQLQHNNEPAGIFDGL